MEDGVIEHVLGKILLRRGNEVGSSVQVHQGLHGPDPSGGVQWKALEGGRGGESAPGGLVGNHAGNPIGQGFCDDLPVIFRQGRNEERIGPLEFGRQMIGRPFSDHLAGKLVRATIENPSFFRGVFNGAYDPV